MKKILRGFLFAVAISCFCIVFAACTSQAESKRLATPSGGKFTESAFCWDGDPNAQEYVLDINGKEVSSYDTEYDISYADIFEYKIRVKSIGDGDKFTDSEWSDYYEVNVPELECEAVDLDTAYKIKKVSAGAIGEYVLPSTYDGKPLTEIGNRAFYECINITSLIVPDSITKIDSSAFEGCEYLGYIKLPKYLKTLNTNVFKGCKNLSEVEIPDGVTGISTMAFVDSGIEKLHIPGTVTDVGLLGFYKCEKLEEITVSPDNGVYRSEGNCIIRKADGVLVCGGSCSVIPDGVREIAVGALSNCDLEYITIPASVRVIGEGAFYNCKKLKRIEFVDKCELGEQAFKNCSDLSELVLTDAICSIKEYAFDGCSSLKNFVLPAGVNEFYANSLNDCSGIEHLSVSENNPVYFGEGDCIIRKSDNVLIRGCKNSEVPDTVKEIGDCAFSGAGLEDLRIGNNVEIIGAYAYETNRLNEIVVPCGVTEIGEAAFNNSYATRIAIPTSVKHIGSMAFARHKDAPACTVTVPETVDTIGASAINCSTVFYAERKEGWEYKKSPYGYFIMWYDANQRVPGCEIGYEYGYSYVIKFDYYVYELRRPDGFVDGIDRRIPSRPGDLYRVGYKFTGYALEPDGTPLTDDEFDAYLCENMGDYVTLYPIYE